MVAELLVILFWLFTGDPRQYGQYGRYVMATVDELLARLVNLENAQQTEDNAEAQQEQALAAAQHRLAQ